MPASVGKGPDRASSSARVPAVPSNTGSYPFDVAAWRRGEEASMKPVAPTVPKEPVVPPTERVRPEERAPNPKPTMPVVPDVKPRVIPGPPTGPRPTPPPQPREVAPPTTRRQPEQKTAKPGPITKAVITKGGRTAI